MKKKKFKQAVCEMLGVLISFLVLVPFLMVLLNSMKSKRQANLLELSLTGISWNQFLENYGTVIREARLVSSFMNSAIVTFLGAALVLSCASMAAFVVVRRKTRAMRAVNNFIVMGLTLPLAMVPVYFMLSKVHMTTGTGAVAGAILVYAASIFPFIFFIYTGFIKGISSEIDEAAIIDGASPLLMYFRIIFPLLKPVTITALMHCVMSIWNDFGISLYLLNSAKRTTAVLTTYLFMGQKASDWQLLFADVVLVSMPIVILYLFMQKYIVAGLSDGAVKG
nr:carbohydrate ABC transporter permease [uncultured Eisenbergiella sp.]